LDTMFQQGHGAKKKGANTLLIVKCLFFNGKSIINI